MPRDHYVAQAYLKQFIDREIDFLHAYKKNNGEHFTPAPKNVCAPNNGSMNIYFRDKRIIEGYLKLIEPHWPECVQALIEKNFTPRIKYLISSYIAFLRSYNPTAKRLGRNYTEFLIDSARPILAKNLKENKDKVPLSEQAIDLLLNPQIKISVKPDYPQAQMMIGLKGLIDTFFESPWEILYNKTTYPFITCDYPAVYWQQKGIHIADLFLPITPHIGIVIKLSTRKCNSDRQKQVEQTTVEYLNKLIVQSAENIVISNLYAAWINSLISKYKNWRVEASHIEQSGQSGKKYIITKIGAKSITNG